MKKDLALLLFLSSPLSAAEISEKDIFAKLESLNAMRLSLASQLKPETSAITEESFKQTCVPVGQELKRWAAASGVVARQISHKNRNPAHAVDPGEQRVYQKFMNEPKLTNWTEKSDGKQSGDRYFVRINVDQACLTCHGPKDKRPAFIVSKYPADQAFDFKPGELRGLYLVTRKP